MINLTSGDMFRIAADYRINTVNCVGVMGKGVALEFKRRYPRMYQDYRRTCLAGMLEPGSLHYFKENDCTVINFPTKVDWRYPSQYEWIRLGLESLREYLVDKGNAIVTVPALGCGHGGLDWKKVLPLINEYLGSLKETTFWVFDPQTSMSIR